MNRSEYNDIDAPYDLAVFDRLRNNGEEFLQLNPYSSTETIVQGIDAQLSRHVAHLFIRDPLVIFSETIDQDDTTSNDHFEVGTSAETVRTIG